MRHLRRSLHGSVNWNFEYSFQVHLFFKSLPSRERELKSIKAADLGDKHIVAPFTGAWIEIIKSAGSFANISGRSLHGSVNWNMSREPELRELRRRSLHGSVNWNPSAPRFIKYPMSRSLHGSVNWNCIYAIIGARCGSRSLHGSVNWNSAKIVVKKIKSWSLPSRERELKLLWCWQSLCAIGVAPFTGAWIEIIGICTAQYSVMSLPSRERELKL